MAATAPKIQQSHEGEHHGDYGNREIKITKATYLFAMCASINSCNLGYDVGISTNAGGLIQNDFGLSDFQRELFIGSLNFWSLFGALSAHYVSDRYGRRRSFIVAAISFIIGVLIMALAWNFAVLMFGRIFLGLGVGFGLAIDPLYIAEISPAKHRGELVTWAEIALNFGIVLGFSMGLILLKVNDETEWRIMFLVGAVLPVIMIFLAAKIMPESPRWLVGQHREEEAKIVLQMAYEEGFDVDPVIHDIKEALERERAAEKAIGWDVILRPSPAIKRMLMVGVGTAVAQQLVGIDAIQYFMLDILERGGVKEKRDQLFLLIFLGVIKLVFIVVGGVLFDRRGRRPLFITSLIGTSCALLLVGIVYSVNRNVPWGFPVFGLGLYLAFFSLGSGPGAWLIPSEVFATSIRAKAMSVTTFCNRLTATGMASTFLSLANAITWGGYFLLLCSINVMVLVYLYIYLPETKGRSLEDMSIYFAEITGDESILEAERRIVERDRAVGATGGIQMSDQSTDSEVGAQGTLT